MPGNGRRSPTPPWAGRPGPVRWRPQAKNVGYGASITVFAGPLLMLLVSLIPTGLTLDDVATAVHRGVLGYPLNSFVVVGGGPLLQIVVRVSAGYALARKKFPGLRLVFLLILSTMMLRGEILALPLSLVLADVPVVHVSLLGRIIPVGAWDVSILVMTELMKEIPVELVEAVRLDGAGDVRIFTSVILPLCRPALGLIGIFGFTMIWDQYLLPLLVATRSSQFTLPLALRTLRADDNVGLGVLLAAALLPSVIAFVAMQRQFMNGLTAGAIKG